MFPGFIFVGRFCTSFEYSCFLDLVMAIYGPPRLGLNIGLFPSPATTERVGAELPRRWNATGEPIGVGGRVVQYARLQRTPAPSNNRERPSFCAEPIRPHAFLTATTADTATTAWILGFRVRSLYAVTLRVRTNSVHQGAQKSNGGKPTQVNCRCSPFRSLFQMVCC